MHPFQSMDYILYLFYIYFIIYILLFSVSADCATWFMSTNVGSEVKCELDSEALDAKTFYDANDLCSRIWVVSLTIVSRDR